MDVKTKNTGNRPLCTGGFDEEDKEAINDSIYELFEDDEVL